ncbi:MAG: efflux RND transporter periplasmic adaptor subunit, partial [Chloroflexi bacterium]|nr:efflux RND transporter periplasmic adaptor subunit [Chloroflexota bacterium]
MKISKRTAIMLAGSAIIALVAAVTLLPRGNAQTLSAATAEGDFVRRGTLIATVSASGAISPLREASLAFNTTGAVTQLAVKQGDAVKKGQLLAALDARVLDLQIVQAEASLASADAALANLKSPVANDLIIAKADIDKALAALARAQADYDRIGGASNPFIAMTPQSAALQTATLDYQKALAVYSSKINPNENQIKQLDANVRQARAARDLAKQRLEDAILRAPFDGTVTKIDFDLGSYVPAAKPVVTVADTSELRVKVNIDETDIARVVIGQEVTIGLDAYPSASINARVSDVAAAATTVQGVVNYIVTVTLNPGDVPVKIGMTANANVVVAKKDNVLLVPNRAVRAVGAKRFVTIQKTPEQTQDIEVKLGLANDQETEVVSGLEEGQQLVINLGPAQNPV